MFSKMNLAFFAPLPVLFSITTNAVADNNFYVQLNGGASFVESFHRSRQDCFSFGCVSSRSKESYDDGFLGGLALGYRVNEQFRIEGEGFFQSNDMDKGVVNLSGPFGNNAFTTNLQGERERIAFLLNSYYDFKNSSAFTPYITTGLGGYHMHVNYQQNSYENDVDFAWQAGAGVNYAITDQIGLDLKYRYFGGTDAEINVPGVSNLTANSKELREVGDHQIVAGVRVGF